MAIHVETKRYAADAAFMEVRAELERAMTTNRPMASAHEGYAVILEELQEVWDHVKKKPKNRNVREMREEARQVAAMAVRFMIDIC